MTIPNARLEGSDRQWNETIAVEEDSEDKGKRPWFFCRDYLVGVGDKFIEARPISISNFLSSRVT